MLFKTVPINGSFVGPDFSRAGSELSQAQTAFSPTSSKPHSGHVLMLFSAGGKVSTIEAIRDCSFSTIQYVPIDSLDIFNMPINQENATIK